VDSSTTSRRNFLRLAMAVPLAGSALAACGTSGPSQAGAGGGGSAPAAGGTTYWYLSGQPSEGVRTNALNRWNQANPNDQIQGTTFQNDAYKTRIRTAVGANQAPTIIWGWGGGTLRSYVQAGQVEDLSAWFDQNASVKSRLFQSAWTPATVNGKIYAMPAETVQPIILYWNKRVFDKVGAQPPQSWGDVMNLVPKFNAAGIAPFSLGGQSRWTNMMWLEFLFDRIGGSEVFQAVADGQQGSWSNPSAIDALTKVQDLVKANGFIKGFSSITADSNADLALLYTDKAAMMLHGSWTYGTMSSDGGDFVSGGHLGYMNFPPVEGGKGDPTATTGNPAQYLSISSKATDAQKETAKKFFATGVLADAEIQDWIGTGGVPIVNGADAKITGSKDADFLNFVYGVASKAKSFPQSWDQALSPTAAEKLLDNISQLFQLSITPQQFADNMNGVIGQ
jgi:raffinose/stachyose/melibiose transport system substrate-binding protein